MNNHVNKNNPFKAINTAKKYCKRAYMNPKTPLSLHCSLCQITVELIFFC